MRLCICGRENEPPPLLAFCIGMDKKLKQKLKLMLLMLEQAPDGILREPMVKHFQMERYLRLYELKVKSRAAMVRVIYTYWRDGKILLLTPFYKTQPRDTEKALEKALRLLAEVEAGNSSVRDLPIELLGDMAGENVASLLQAP